MIGLLIAYTIVNILMVAIMQTILLWHILVWFKNTTASRQSMARIEVSWGYGMVEIDIWSVGLFSVFVIMLL